MRSSRARNGVACGLILAAAFLLSGCGAPAKDPGAPNFLSGHCSHAAAEPADWSIDLHAPVVTSLSVSGDCMLLGTGDHRMLALDTRTGAARWWYVAGNSLSGAAVHHNVAVFSVANHQGTDGSAIVGLDVVNERVLWYDALNTVPLTGANSSSAFVYGTADGALQSVDVISGRQRWSRHLSGFAQDSTIASAGVVALATVAGRATAVDTVSGRVLWERPLDSDPASVRSSAISIVGSRAFIAFVVRARDGRTTERLEALRLATGAPVWSTTLGSAITAGNENLRVGLSVAQGRVFVGNPLHPNVAAVNASSGKLVWRAASKQEVTVAPIAVGAQIAAVSRDGSLSLYDINTGKTRVAMPLLPAAPAADPIAIGNHIVDADALGHVESRRV